VLDRPLPSGRRLVVTAALEGEELEVRSPDGLAELRITLTDAGPVIRISGARLELDATDTVAIRGRRVEVEATEEAEVRTGGDLKLRSAGEMNLRASEDVVVRGEIIRLN
jgi:hypothetical protein